MNVTDHARDAALLRVLKIHRVAAPNDRVLVAELEGTWNSKIGLRRHDLLDAIDRMLVAGRFVHCSTMSGAALQLTERGARELGQDLPTPGRSRFGRIIHRLINSWNTFFVLRIARRRTLSRLRFVGSIDTPQPSRRNPAESREAMLARVSANQAPAWSPPPAAPGSAPSRALPARGSSGNTVIRQGR